MFDQLKQINRRPKAFEFYTASDLWDDEHTSAQMLKYHLNEAIDVSSRNAPFIAQSVDWIISHFNVTDRTKIADFGCGPGLYTTKLARTGADVTGIDFSKRSIEYAQQAAASQGLTVHYINQNYLEFETDERFDLIMMIMCDFCALSPDQRKVLLEKFGRFLKPGGAVLLDAYSLEAFDKRQEQAIYEKNLLDGFWSADEYYCFLNTFKYQAEKVCLDKYTIIEAARTRTVYNWLQYFDCDMIEQEFTGAGFTIDTFYSNVAGTPFDSTSDEFAVVAGKA